MKCSVRAMGDRVSLSCVQVSKYSAEAKIENESNLTIESPQDNSANGVEKDKLNIIDVDNSANGVDYSNNGVENLTNGMNKIVEANTNNGFNKLILEIQDDGIQDNALEFIDNIAQVLLEHRGNVQVGLRVLFDGAEIHLDWPQVNVDLSDQLEEKLKLLLEGRGKIDIKNS